MACAQHGKRSALRRIALNSTRPVKECEAGAIKSARCSLSGTSRASAKQLSRPVLLALEALFASDEYQSVPARPSAVLRFR